MTYTRREFKLGDRVRIVRSAGRTGYQYVSGEYELTKQHKGNGNFIIDKEHYDKWGSKRSGRSTWGPYYNFVLSGSDELKKIVQRNRAIYLKRKIRDNLEEIGKLSRGMTLEDLENFNDAVGELLEQYGQPTDD